MQLQYKFALQSLIKNLLPQHLTTNPRRYIFKHYTSLACRKAHHQKYFNNGYKFYSILRTKNDSLNSSGLTVHLHYNAPVILFYSSTRFRITSSCPISLSFHQIGQSKSVLYFLTLYLSRTYTVWPNLTNQSQTRLT